MTLDFGGYFYNRIILLLYRMRRFTTGSSSIPHRVDSDSHGSCTRNTTIRTHKQTDEESSSSSETMLWLLCCEAFQRIIPWKDLCYTSFHCNPTMAAGRREASVQEWMILRISPLARSCRVATQSVSQPVRLFVCSQCSQSVVGESDPVSLSTAVREYGSIRAYISWSIITVTGFLCKSCRKKRQNVSFGGIQVKKANIEWLKIRKVNKSAVFEASDNVIGLEKRK